jgi:hypothetical protein
MIDSKSEQKDLPKLIESKGHNPFEVMVKLKMFKEDTVRKTKVRYGLVGELEEFELTQEFREFAYSNYYMENLGPTDNIYTPHCIYRYLIEERGIKVGNKYEQDKSIREEQIIEFYRILLFYFLVRAIDDQTMNSIIEHRNPEDLQCNIRDAFQYVQEIVSDLLLEEYDNSGMKKTPQE